MLNDALAAEGKASRVFIEPRSFKDRGSSLPALTLACDRLTMRDAW